MRKGIFIALALCAALCYPTMARAEEIDYVDSFANGIETLKGEGINEQVTPEMDYISQYEPVMLTAEPKAQTDGELTINDNIANVVDGWTQIPVNTGKTDMLNFARWFVSSGGGSVNGVSLVTMAAGICFAWWGIRKSIRMIMASFRKGKANV